jgi:hypothetical protein
MSKIKKLIVIVHGRHGKDTFCEILRDYHGHKFISSSRFVGERSVWPTWGVAYGVWESFEQCYADRSSYRASWAREISAYNTPDKTRTASEMLDEGYDMYCGMRQRDELEACKDKGLFDHIIWVDRSDHCPPEPLDSMNLTKEDADFVVDNNGSMVDLWIGIYNLVQHHNL